MTSPPAQSSEGPAAQLVSCRARQLREQGQHRVRAARTVTRMARDQHDESLLLSILDLKPVVGTTTPSLDSALADYVRQVAEQVGVPLDAVTHEVTDTATAYLGLTSSTADRPHCDLMLVWDERLGWSVAIEPRGNDQLSPVPPQLDRTTLAAHMSRTRA